MRIFQKSFFAFLVLFVFLWSLDQSVLAQTFALPTPNRDILNPATVKNYFVPTVGRTWESGTFGCVRSERQQIHEGIDIRSTASDKKGESTDPIFCTAEGIVVHTCTSPSKSSYGRYIVVRHEIDGIEIYSLYAHLASVAGGIKPGVKVKQGQKLGILGRSANTRSGISKDRAHLHFELCLYLNPYFSSWFEKNYPNQDTQEGFHGWNLVGMDPWLIFREEWKKKDSFNLADFIRKDRDSKRIEKEQLCRVLIYQKNFPFAKRYPRLIAVNSRAEKEGIVAWEVAFDYNGVPFVLIPRAASEVGARKTKFVLLSANEEEATNNPGRHFIRKVGKQWKMTDKFTGYLNQITYLP